MVFDLHKEALRISKTPYVPLEAGRGLSDGDVIVMPDTDLSAETMVCVVAEVPGGKALATLPVDIETETRTWQSYVDEDCIPKHYFPCGINMEDTITTSLLTVSWSPSSFSNVPENTKVKGEPLNLYYEIRRDGNIGPRYVAGDLILTESNIL